MTYKKKKRTYTLVYLKERQESHDTQQFGSAFLTCLLKVDIIAGPLFIQRGINICASWVFVITLYTVV